MLFVKKAQFMYIRSHKGDKNKRSEENLYLQNSILAWDRTDSGECCSLRFIGRRALFSGKEKNRLCLCRLRWIGKGLQACAVRKECAFQHFRSRRCAQCRYTGGRTFFRVCGSAEGCCSLSYRKAAILFFSVRFSGNGLGGKCCTGQTNKMNLAE